MADPLAAPIAPESASRSDPVARMRAEVVAGLTKAQKELQPKYFYDHRGSELFEEITRLEEYYPTRTERALLDLHATEWIAAEPPRELVELGAGSAEKTRLVLDEIVRHHADAKYVPVDVSADFLRATAERLRQEYPTLSVAPAVADISEPFDVTIELREPTWFALLGSTIGNFDTAPASRLLRSIADRMGPADRFLMGADLRPGPHKTKERLEAAYNDEQGVTAEFNRNVLRVLNRSLDADFDLDDFAHEAFYEEEHGRIEMHLRALRGLTVHIPGAEPVSFAEGESVRTEISCKYDRDVIDQLFAGAGLEVNRWAQDSEGLFALILARKARPVLGGV